MQSFRSSSSRKGVLYPELTQDLIDLGLAASHQAVRDVVAGKNLGDPAEYAVIKILEACAPELAKRERQIFREALEAQFRTSKQMNPVYLLDSRDRR